MESTNTVKVSVKWGKQLLEDIEVDKDLPPLAFKAQLCSLTGVPPERQRVLGFKGGPLRDESDWQSTNLKDGLRLMLVGTSEGSEIKSSASTSAASTAKSSAASLSTINKNVKNAEESICGLINLGNTCYLNSVIQLLYSASEIKQAALEALPDESPASTGVDADTALCASFKSFLKSMSKLDEGVPLVLLETLRKRYPLFATKSRSENEFAQQDAEECFSALLTSFAVKTDKIDDLLKITFKTTMKCLESSDEEPAERTDTARHLSCHTGTQLKPVGHIYEGIKLSLDESMRKHSPVLNRDAEYAKEMRIDKLPKYLVTHFVRFAWKGASELGRTEAGRAKVCRKIAFPQTLDVYEFCTPELQKELKKGRSLNRLKALLSGTSPAPPSLTVVPPAEETAKLENEKKRGLRSGHYELTSVVTHRGRSADSGHYIAWTKKDDELWFKLDDDKVSLVRWKDVDVSGGRADFHIAILALYKEVLVEGTEDQIIAAEKDLDTFEK